MPFTFRLTAIARTVLAVGLLLLAPTCRADLGALDPASKPTTRFGPGYELALSVSVQGQEEEELCRQFTLDAEGRLELKLMDQPIPKIPLRGLTAEQARKALLDTLSKYFAEPPDVKVGVARIPRFRVRILGATLRQGPVTLTDGSRLSDALAEAGFAPNADLTNIAVDRVEPNGERVKLTVDFARAAKGETQDARSDPELREGDVVTLSHVAPLEVVKRVAVQGEVLNPGFFTLRTGMTARDLLMEARGLKPEADPARATLVRTTKGQLVSIDATKALNRVATDNLPLEPDDVLVVPTKDRGMVYAVAGLVANPSTFEFRGKPTLKQAIVDAKGFKPDADRHNILLIRNMTHDPARAQPVQLDYDKIASGAIPDIPLQPGDVIQVLPKPKRGSPLATVGALLLRFLLPF